MNKITLSVLMLGFMLVIISIVGAAITGVAFNTPTAEMNISGVYNVTWNNSVGHPNMYLQYRSGDCYTGSWSILTGPFNDTVKNYLWNTSARTDGRYCLRIEYSGNETLSGNFTIDNTAPNITFDNTPYFVVVNESIFINASLVDGNYIKNYTIDFGDNSADNETDVGVASGSVNASHSYNTSGQHTVTITVRDNAGNSVVSTKVVTVNAATPDWIMDLSSGQNLISIPFVPNDTSYYSSGSSTHYKNALGGIRADLNRVWGYTFDTSTNLNTWKYRKTTSTAWSTSGSLSDIVPGYGYILFMDNESTLYGTAKMISNDPDSEPVVPSSVKLANGYNLIGVFGSNSTNLMTDALSSLKSLDGDSYWHKLYYVNGTEKVENLTSEEGYWISMMHTPDGATDDYYTYYP